MLRVEKGDVFVLATDGVYEHVGDRLIAATIKDNAGDLDQAAQGRRRAGLSSTAATTTSRSRSSASTNCPTATPARCSGSRANCRCRRCSKRGRCSTATGSSANCTAPAAATSISPSTSRPRTLVVIKIPSIDLRDDPAYLKRFMMEEWVARRINSAACAQALPAVAQAQFPLRRHRIHRRPDADAMDDRQSEADAGNGARHRRADRQGAAGLPPDGDAASGPAARQHHDRQDRHGEDHRFRLDQVAGVVEAAPSGNRNDILGTAQYTAPEYFLGESGTSRSDLFSLGVITYQMLTGRLPYGAAAAKARTRIAVQPGWSTARPRTATARFPVWIDGMLEQAVHPDPFKRYDSLSEFLHDLRHPNANYRQHFIDAADRAQSAAVLEEHDHRAGAGGDRAAGDAARDAPVSRFSELGAVRHPRPSLRDSTCASLAAMGHEVHRFEARKRPVTSRLARKAARSIKA